jgi:uncharacterized membrane protein YfcA
LLQNTIQLSAIFSNHADWRFYTAFLLIMMLSGFVSGLSGFGFSAVGAALMLFLKPTSAVALLLLLSLFAQMLSLKSLWAETRQYVKLGNQQDSLLPYLVGGCAGVPLGVLFLHVADPKKLVAVLGGILLFYALYSLSKPKSWVLAVQPSWGKSALVGAVGGMIGGFSAFPGSAVVVWTGLQSLPKEQVRAITQPYIVAMQTIGLMTFMLCVFHAMADTIPR